MAQPPPQESKMQNSDDALLASTTTNNNQCTTMFNQEYSEPDSTLGIEARRHVNKVAMNKKPPAFQETETSSYQPDPTFDIEAQAHVAPPAFQESETRSYQPDTTIDIEAQAHNQTPPPLQTRSNSVDRPAGNQVDSSNSVDNPQENQVDRTDSVETPQENLGDSRNSVEIPQEHQVNRSNSVNVPQENQTDADSRPTTTPNSHGSLTERTKLIQSKSDGWGEIQEELNEVEFLMDFAIQELSSIDDQSEKKMKFHIAFTTYTFSILLATGRTLLQCIEATYAAWACGVGIVLLSHAVVNLIKQGNRLRRIHSPLEEEIGSIRIRYSAIAERLGSSKSFPQIATSNETCKEAKKAISKYNLLRVKYQKMSSQLNLVSPKNVVGGLAGLLLSILLLIFVLNSRCKNNHPAAEPPSST